MAGSATLDNNVLVDSLVTDVIDGLRRELHPQFGVRPYKVFTVLRTYAGESLGEGGFEDVETEIDPQPRVAQWDGKRYDLTPAGLDENGEVRLTEVSLTYTHDELTGGTLEGNQQFFFKIAEAHGQGNPDRYYILSRPPFVDREKDMGWVLTLRAANVPGCGG